jgi:hypothetical protein
LIFFHTLWLILKIKYTIITLSEPEDVEDDEVKEVTENKEPEPLPQLSSGQLLLNRQQKLQERKRKIALLSSSVIENPEENVWVILYYMW